MEVVKLVPKITNRDRFGNFLDVNQMLKRFKRSVAKEQIMDEVRKHEYFLPRSIKRKLKSEKHERLMRKLSGKKQKQNQ